MSRSINKAIIIGNLTRDPEMRYTPSGQAVTNFGVATNRRWKTNEGEDREEAEFHNVVAWGKLAEICSQLLRKGSRVYVEGRLRTRSWEGKDGVTRYRTEIVAGDMALLESRAETEARGGGDYVAAAGASSRATDDTGASQPPAEPSSAGAPLSGADAGDSSADDQGKGKKKGKKPAGKDKSSGGSEDVPLDEIPF